MSGDLSDFSVLADRYRKLGGADRRAVLAKLDIEAREALERRLAAEKAKQSRKRAEDRRADRQFARYSRPLAAKVEGAVRGSLVEDGGVTEACAEAVASAHRMIEDSTEPPSLPQLLRELGARLLSVATGERR